MRCNLAKRGCTLFLYYAVPAKEKGSDHFQPKPYLYSYIYLGPICSMFANFV